MLVDKLLRSRMQPFRRSDYKYIQIRVHTIDRSDVRAERRLSQIKTTAFTKYFFPMAHFVSQRLRSHRVHLSLVPPPSFPLILFSLFVAICIYIARCRGVRIFIK